MDVAIQTADQWLANNRAHMITCPLQPGQLRITDRACARRHQMAQDTVDKRTPDSAFLFAIHMNLQRCRDCRVGRAKAGVIEL